MDEKKVIAAWLRKQAADQWNRAATHCMWEPAREWALVRAMWLFDRAIELEEEMEAVSCGS